VPLYEYKCDNCGETFEVIQKFADEPLTVHEKCGGPVHRLLSAPAFQFKGTGWYVTDYAKGNTTVPPKHDSGKSESSGKTGESTTTATETKTETKTESKPGASSDKT
jgi:putative FmdB family regulatory protein